MTAADGSRGFVDALAGSGGMADPPAEVMRMQVYADPTADTPMKPAGVTQLRGGDPVIVLSPAPAANRPMTGPPIRVPPLPPPPPLAARVASFGPPPAHHRSWPVPPPWVPGVGQAQPRAPIAGPSPGVVPLRHPQAIRNRSTGVRQRKVTKSQTKGGGWVLLVVLMIILFSSGLGQRLISLLEELLNR